MNDVTVEALEAFTREVWVESVDAWDLEVKCSRHGNSYHIKVSAMYEAPGLTLARLNALAGFLGTTNIDTADRYYYPGCDTCDYGSEAGFTLIAEPES